MKRLEKGVIGLILVIFAGTVIMAVSSGGQKAVQTPSILQSTGRQSSQPTTTTSRT